MRRMKHVDLINLQVALRKLPYNADEVWSEHLAGKYLSGWPYLGHATRSCLVHAASNTQTLLNQFLTKKDNIQNDNQRLELWFSLDIAYNNQLIGPLLSTVLLSAFSVESFVRLTTNCALQSKCKSQARVDEELAKFDGVSLPTRVKRMYGLLSLPEPKEKLMKQIVKLTDYRNACAHDEPRLYGQPGEMKKFKGGRKGPKRTTRIQDRMRPFTLADVNRPVSLRDAHWAASTHDRIVANVWDKAERHLRARLFNEVEIEHAIILSPTQLALAIEGIDNVSQAIAQLAARWESEVELWSQS